jgi:hypothetical protein
VYVYVSDAAALLNVQDFLRRSECVVVKRRSHELEVFVPGQPDDQARREVSISLATWQAMNPGIDTYIVDQHPAETT